MHSRRIRQVMTLAGLGGTSLPAFAAATGAGAVPWEAPLQTVVTSMTGPVAFSGSAIALAAAFLTLAFNNDLTGFGRYLVYLALAVSGLLFVTNVLTTVFGAGADTTSPLVARQVLVVFLFIGLCTVLALVQWILWALLTRRWPPKDQSTVRSRTRTGAQTEPVQHRADRPATTFVIPAER